MIRCKCGRAFRLRVRYNAGKKTYMEARPTTSGKRAGYGKLPVTRRIMR